LAFERAKEKLPIFFPKPFGAVVIFQQKQAF
jgi:hypothetical protein